MKKKKQKTLLVRRIHKRVEELYVKYSIYPYVVSVRIGQSKRAKRLPNGYKGSAREYRDTVLKYWKPYGVKPKRFWYTITCAGSDHYDPRYIPNDIWMSEILPYFNDRLLWRAYCDKSMLDVFCPGVKQPEVVVKSMGSSFFDGKGNKISREQAIEICQNESEIILKPAVVSGQGRHISFYEKGVDKPEKICEIFDGLKRDFIVQHLVKQHPDLARVHPASLNTIRMITFMFKGEFYVLSTILRMGSGDAKVDNVSAGGIACAVHEDGSLFERSVTHKSEWSDAHPSGVKFKDIRIPNYDKVVATAKRLHENLPYFGIIGWDFSVDEAGDPALVEFNLNPGQNQSSMQQPTFGDLTEDVLRDVFIEKTLTK